MRQLQWSTFLSATLGYGMYYVCRLDPNAVKKSIVEEGVFSETELDVVGAVLSFIYAVGRFTNGSSTNWSNINRFMSTGLLVTALINLFLGSAHSFILFATLWGIGGWFQSMGTAPCVIGLSRWLTDKEHGSFYGFWGTSHNIEEAMIFIIVASIVSALGWRYDPLGIGLVGLIGVLIIWRLFHDSPQSKGLPAINTSRAKKTMNTLETEEFSRAQKSVSRSPATWIFAFSSTFVYISRYAANSWGVFHLQVGKGYSTLDASFIISISSVCGIIGVMFSGVVSDKFFGDRRNIPALIPDLMSVVALCLLLFAPGVHFWLNVSFMVFFGSGIGMSTCPLGGLMAVDVAPRAASGTASGVVGIANYIGAGLQDMMSDVLIEDNKYVVNDVEVCDFIYINWLWVRIVLISVSLASSVRNARNRE